MGKEKRRNAQRLKEELGKAWDEDGVARVALRTFLEKHSGENEFIFWSVDLYILLFDPEIRPYRFSNLRGFFLRILMCVVLSGVQDT